MSTYLTWALVVATKDRLDALQHCVRFALGQSRPPSEVIIVDASATWEAHRETITALLTQHADIRFTYLQAPRPSLTLQRNTGILEARADILFLIDDDSFLYPQAAAEIMRLYEADTNEALAGVQLQPTPAPPEGIAGGVDQARDANQKFRIRSGKLRRLVRRLLQHGLEAGWLPYDKTWPDRPMPAHFTPPKVRPARLFHGFRMTFRRKVAAKLLFDPLLLYYCPGEDLDFSHRAAQTGALVTARDAPVHHFVAKGGRLKRRQVTLLSTLNRAVFLRQYSPDQSWARRAFAGLILHRAFSEVVRDIGSGAFALPGTRGTLQGLWMSRQIFQTPPDKLGTIYPALQEKIVKGVQG